MVHWGGQETRGSGPGARDSAREARRSGLAVGLALALALVASSPSPAAAQPSVGFQGGVAVDPEQVYGGVFWQTGDLARGIRLRPGIDGGIGQGYRIAEISAMFIYGFPLGASGWTLVQGGGPAVVVTRVPDFDYKDTGVGASYLIGFGHDSGFFVEARLGSGASQRLKFGVGWAIALN